MITEGIIAKLLSYVWAPIAALLAVIGYYHRRQLLRVDQMENKVNDLGVTSAINRAHIKHIRNQCDDLNHKIDRILEKL